MTQTPKNLRPTIPQKPGRPAPPRRSQKARKEIFDQVAVAPAPPLAEIEEADLDELTRTSLSASLDEVMNLHHRELDEALAAEMVRMENEQEAQILEAERARLLAEARRVAKLESERRAELERREQSARRRGAEEGRVRALSLGRKKTAALEHNGRILSEEREIVALQTKTKKRHFVRALQAAAVLGALALTLFGGAVLDVNADRAEARTAHTVEVLEAREVAQARVAALEAKLIASTESASESQRALEGELLVAREMLSKAQEEAVRVDERRPPATPQKLARVISAPKSPAPVVAQKKDVVVNEPAPRAVSDATVYEANGCVAYDPMCFEL